MPGTYRVEIAKTGRAGCQATRCKQDGVKIDKGELRQGVLVTIGENTSWKYRHWGCVTPVVLRNWNETCEGDMDLVDGYDELPDKEQGIVRLALTEGHVDDEDWKGDAECNRIENGHTGMFLVKRRKVEDRETGDEASPSKAAAGKKRSRKAADDEEVEAKPAPKKDRGKKAAKVEKEDDEPIASPPPAKRARKSKKAVVEEDEDEAAEPPARKPRARKAKSAAAVVDDEDEEDEAPVPAKKGKAKPKATKAAKGADADANDTVKTKPQVRKGRGKKAAVAEDED